MTLDAGGTAVAGCDGAGDASGGDGAGLAGKGESGSGGGDGAGKTVSLVVTAVTLTVAPSDADVLATKVPLCNVATTLPALRLLVLPIVTRPSALLAPTHKRASSFWRSAGCSMRRLSYSAERTATFSASSVASMETCSVKLTAVSDGE